MKLKTLCISLAILTTICLMTATASPAASITTSDYWILTDGYSAQFTNSGTLNVTYGNFNAKDVFFVNLMGTGTQMQNYDASGNLLYYGTRHGSGWYFTVDPGAALFPSEMEIGKTYPPVTWDRIEYDDWGAYHGIGRDSVVVTVTDPMPITVPAGSFDDVYKFTLVDTWSDSWGNSGVSTSEYWVAKDIGWVKVMREGVTYELLNVPILPPTATTGTGTSVGTSTATLNGTVNPRSGSTTVVFEYGPTTAYGIQITAAQSPLSGTTDQAVSAQLTGLSECTPYHFRVKATNSAGTDWGDDQTFTTSCGSKPTVKTNHASQVTLSSAMLNGKVNPNYRETTWYFEYGLTTGYEWSTPSESAGSGSAKVSVSRNITGLNRDTTYHYRIVAENSRGESLGKDKTFRTTIVYVEPYGACGANEPCYETIQEAMDAAGSGGTIKIAEESYYEDVVIGASGNVRIEGGWDDLFTARSSIAELSSTAITGTLVIGSEMDGTVLVDRLVLQTECTASPPLITTGSANAVTCDSATLNGTVNPNSGNTTYWFRYGKTTAYGTTTPSNNAGAGSSALPVNASISGLSADTIYHYQVVATNCAGTSYGTDKTFTTSPATTPTVRTTAVSKITSNSASSGGSITSDGGASVTARGVCWSTSANPTISNSHTSDGNGTGAFTSNITGLSSATAYHVRAYATNSAGTNYGSDQTFTTLPEKPTVTTGSATSVTTGSATLNGTVNPNGASTTYYFQYGTNTSYGSNTSSTSAGSGSSSVSANGPVSGLTCNTTYHYRLVATNSAGTSYGSNRTFVTGACDFSLSPTSLNLSTGQTGSCTISGGTSPYSASSSNMSVAAASVSGSTLNVTGLSAGSATVTVSDSGSASAMVSVTVSDQSQIIFSDDFESYSVGTFPSSGGWELVYNGYGTSYQVVTDGVSVSPTQSLKLEGRTNWAAGAARQLPSAPSVVFFEVSVRTMKVDPSVMTYHEAAVGLWSDDSGPWTWYAHVFFRYDGEIQFGAWCGPTIGLQWEPNTWYRVKIKYDNINRRADLWIDGVLVVSDVDMSGPSGSYDSVLLEGGNDTHTRSWFDDVKVYYDTSTFDLSVSPAALNLSTGQTGSCTISGGTSPYSASSNNTSVATASVTGSTLSVTGVSSGSATVTVSDSGSDSATVSVTVSDQSQIIFSDDFESYSVGTFPSSGSWELVYNGYGTSYQVVTDGVSVSPTQSLKLEGQTNWAAGAARQLPSAPDVVFFEVSVRTMKVNPSVMNYSEAAVGLWSDSTGSWTHYAQVCFRYDGEITFGVFGGPTIGRQWEPHTWYRVKIKYDNINRRADLWIDGVLVVSDVDMSGPSGSYDSVLLEGGNDTHTRSWFDDVKVY